MEREDAIGFSKPYQKVPWKRSILNEAGGKVLLCRFYYCPKFIEWILIARGSVAEIIFRAFRFRSRAKQICWCYWKVAFLFCTCLADETWMQRITARYVYCKTIKQHQKCNFENSKCFFHLTKICWIPICCLLFFIILTPINSFASQAVH